MIAGIGLGVLILLTLVAVPPSKLLLEQWSRADVESRSRLVHTSVQGPVRRSMADGDEARLASILQGVAADDRVFAVGVCDPKGDAGATELMPSDFTCEGVARSEGESFTSIGYDGRRVLVAVFPIEPARKPPISPSCTTCPTSTRDRASFRPMSSQLLGFGLLIAGPGAFMVLYLARLWIASLRKAVEDIRRGKRPIGAQREGFVIERQIELLFKELEAARTKVDTAEVAWSPQTLHDLLNTTLQRAQMIIVSNREPYIHNRATAASSCRSRPAAWSSALEPVMRACGGTWIAHGSGSADRETVDANDRLRVPPAIPPTRCAASG